MSQFARFAVWLSHDDNATIVLAFACGPLLFVTVILGWLA